MTRKFVKRSKFFAHVLSTLFLAFSGIKDNENSFVLENLAELSIKIPQSDWSFGLFWKISQSCQSKCYNLIGRLVCFGKPPNSDRSYAFPIANSKGRQQFLFPLRKCGYENSRFLGGERITSSSRRSLSSWAEERPGCWEGLRLERWLHQPAVCSTPRHFGRLAAGDGVRSSTSCCREQRCQPTPRFLQTSTRERQRGTLVLRSRRVVRIVPFSKIGELDQLGTEVRLCY